jgi:hypothetical protein
MRVNQDFLVVYYYLRLIVDRIRYKFYSCSPKYKGEEYFVAKIASRANWESLRYKIWVEKDYDNLNSKIL